MTKELNLELGSKASIVIGLILLFSAMYVYINKIPLEPVAWAIILAIFGLKGITKGLVLR